MFRLRRWRYARAEGESPARADSAEASPDPCNHVEPEQPATLWHLGNYAMAQALYRQAQAITKAGEAVKPYKNTLFSLARLFRP